MAQQAGEVALGAGALRRLHRFGQRREIAVQALHRRGDAGALALAEIGEPAHLAVERRVPVDAAARRIGLGNRQQVGMLARQALGDRRAQLRRGAPHGIARQSERAIALQRLTGEKRSGHLSSSVPF